MIVEYCYYCRKDTETIKIKGGDCKICSLSKVTPINDEDLVDKIMGISKIKRLYKKMRIKE